MTAPASAGGRWLYRVEIPSTDRSFDTGFDCRSDHRYRFLAEGSWIDRNPPAVDASGIAHPGGIRERLHWAKRLPSAPWMALLGRIEGHEWFVIGLGSELTGLPAGRLICCANDVVGFYGNNQGSIALSIFEV